MLYNKSGGKKYLHRVQPHGAASLVYLSQYESKNLFKG